MNIMEIMTRVLEWVRPHIPIDTGNMRYNSPKIEITGSYLIDQTVGSTDLGVLYFDDEIAPYIYYTNEPWISPKWHGKKNPNEGWVDNLVGLIAERLAAEYGGELTAANQEINVNAEFGHREHIGADRYTWGIAGGYYD